MTQTPSYTVENPSFEPTKVKNQYNIYYSFLPILLSIFTYILIFYVLDVSPLLIFNNTKILFFISNTLVLFIAADYGAFAERENHDLYGEYAARTRSDRSENSDYGMGLAEEIKKCEKQKEAVLPRYLLHKEDEVPEKTLQVVSENTPRSKLIQKQEPTTENNISNGETCNARKKVNPKPYGRSKSDKARSERRHQEIKPRPKSYRRSKSDDSSKWMVVHKEKKKAHEEAEEKWENVREESEEFAKMSNEEVNRRVEDFIQRFNRDIKRQSLV
ncbi:Uncharacterized protein Rs2_17561 [Raphanus sativus]|uniref:Uncharacterized protein LOC108852572 n=1 Tax=Raphanus sativus TaxID=3726 RepID=A0A6J0NAQ7_RAPSA|nr:uncharacterized protein LOC108852572 [Raphanus sativus]KAJ4903610.1 Uncharacterized protein Rs2_17561 [Raphanus sativus]